MTTNIYTDHKYSTRLHFCASGSCVEKTQHDFYRVYLKAGMVGLHAYLEYAICQQCQKVNESTAFIEVDADSTPEDGIFNSVRIPATSDAWHTSHGDDMWFKLFHPHKRELTSKEVEARYGLKPGAARQAYKRGYIKARLLGSLLLFDVVDTEAYWNYRAER